MAAVRRNIASNELNADEIRLRRRRLREDDDGVRIDYLLDEIDGRSVVHHLFLAFDGVESRLLFLVSQN
jgi:hypothetical protein